MLSTMKHKNLFFTLFVLIFASCKSPLPIYFDKSIGDNLTEFPKSMQGYYYGLDDLVNEGKQKYSVNYRLNNGIISIYDSTQKVQEVEPEESVNVADTVKPLPVEEPNEFYKIADLNSIGLKFIDDTLGKGKKIEYGYIKISKNLISFTYLDSLHENHEAALLKLNENLKLTSYSGDYYLNLKTSFGWELIQIVSWNDKAYLNFTEFYFTNYDDKTGDEKVFLKSTENIYPNLKPIYNAEHKIIGLKAKTNPEKIERAFKNSEFTLGLVKVE